MKKTVFIALTVTLLMALSTITLAQAVPLKDKNNEKFQNFSVTGTYSFLGVLLAEHEYIPSIDNVNRLVINQDEAFSTYAITIGERTYMKGTDFTYTGHAVYTFNQPVFGSTLLGKLYPTDSSANSIKIDYMFEFLPASGIQGTLNMQGTFTEGGSFINSLAGTGDLQNVQIKATASSSISGMTLTISHEGTVLGWPQ